MNQDITAFWEWGMGNGEWSMGNGEWGMGNGEWVIVFDAPTNN